MKYESLRKFRMTNDNVDLDTYKENRKRFKNICKIKKIQYFAQQRQKLMESRSNPTHFWDMLKKHKQKENFKANINLNEWKKYFNKLLYNENQPEIIDQDNIPIINING